jgi:hypothetical protein
MHVMTAARADCSALRRQAVGPAKGNPPPARHGWPPAPVASTCQQATRAVHAEVARRAAGQTVAPIEAAADGPAHASTNTSDVALSPRRPSLSPTLLLVGVSLLWGTYAPALRFLYTLDHPPSPALLTALRTVISAASLLALSSFAPATTGASGSLPQDGTTTSTLPSLPSTGWFSSMLWAAAQLAIFNFLGTALQAEGMQATTSTKGAFLGQLTAVITPTLALATGESVPAAIWAACCLGMAGGVMMALDSSPAAALAQETLSVDAAGPAAILLGCVFYSLVTVQLSKYAPHYDPLHLASAKVACLAALSVAWYAWDVAAGEPYCPRVQRRLLQCPPDMRATSASRYRCTVSVLSARPYPTDAVRLATAQGLHLRVPTPPSTV